MRDDDFSKAVRDVLAARAGHCCSFPGCGVPTSGPAEQPDKSASIGVAAHITAAAEGGPRYDVEMTSAQRKGVGNGIWMCQTHSRLIDTDPQRFPVALLLQWKAESEELARRKVSLGIAGQVRLLDLSIPSQESADSLLSYANTSIAYAGRSRELDDLKEFLAGNQLFSWWLWTGPAGVGKSRLAVEMCRLTSDTWHSGFIREAHQSRLGDLQPLRPTFVVVDYAAQRSAWLSDALAQQSQRTAGSRVRVLILEREAAGTWWEVAQRKDRIEESVAISSTMYALPRPLEGLDRASSRAVIADTAAQLGYLSLTTTQIEDIADQAEHIDPDRRPLFVQVATMNWLDTNDGGASRDNALRRLLSRSSTQLTARVGDLALAGLAQNVQILATSLGGLDAPGFASLSQRQSAPAGLLPSAFQVFGSVSMDDLLDGVRPDILGELFVLDRLAAQPTLHLATIELLRVAWLADPDTYRGFVERTAADHGEHPRLLDLLIASGAPGEMSVEQAELAVAMIRLLKRSDHSVLKWIFERFAHLTNTQDERLEELLIIATYRFANLILREGKTQAAYDLYTEALANCNVTWTVHGDILNNRGIALLELGRSEEAVADFATVIDSPAAQNESRACAFNNRADILAEDGNLHGSVADRSRVLELSGTSFNRRYIALSRRADALRKLGDADGALQDIEAILASEDIALEQKMAARLQRAGWLIEAGDIATARRDIASVIASRRNFPQVEERAQQLSEL